MNKGRPASGAGSLDLLRVGYFFLALPKATNTVSVTFSAVKPKCLNSTGAGADSP